MELDKAKVLSLAKTPPKHIIIACEALLTAMAWQQVITPIVQTKQIEVLTFFKFAPDEKYADMASPILDPKYSWCLDDDDFTIYHAEMEKWKNEQYPGKYPPDHCPALTAETLVRDAQKVLIDLCEEFTGLSLDMLLNSGLDTLKEYIDLQLRMLARHCGTVESIMQKMFPKQAVANAV